MAQTHADFAFHVIDEFFKQVARSFQKHVVERLVVDNFGPDSGTTLTLTWKSLAKNDHAKQIMNLVHAMIQSPVISPLITSGAIDFERLLSISQIPTGPDVPGAIEEIRKQAAAMVAPVAPIATGASMQLATSPPTSLPDQEAIAERGMRENRSALAQIIAALDDPENIDRRRL